MYCCCFENEMDGIGICVFPAAGFVCENDMMPQGWNLERSDASGVEQSAAAGYKKIIYGVCSIT